MSESKALQTAAAPAAQSAPALQPSWLAYDMEGAAHATLPLAHYLPVLRRFRWRIVAFVAASVIATAVISARLQPQFQSTAAVDIDRQSPAAIIGQDAARAPLNDADQFLATQVKLIQSDSVLRPVDRQFHLRRPGGAGQDEEPVILPALQVTRPPNTYLLLISYRSPDARLAADVANAVARSYVEQSYNIRFKASAALSGFMEKQLAELKTKMEASAAALAKFERDLNVINPEEKTSILSARLLQLNTEYTNAETDRVRKESAYHSVESGLLEAAQVSTQGESLKTLASRLDEARQKFAEVRTHFGPNHPEYRKAAVQVEEIERQIQQSRKNTAERVAVEYRESLNREEMLQKAVAATKAEFDRLNARSFAYQALKREADADKSLYEELVRKIKEAGINAGFQNSSIRIADPARANMHAVFPNMRLNLFLAFFGSALLAVVCAVLIDVLDGTVREAEQVPQLFQTEVMGTLPAVKAARRLTLAGAGAALVPSTDFYRAASPFEEAVRTLRNSILLGSFDGRLKSLMVTSAASGEGKTTTAVHLAIAHAQQKHKTLLIDGDLRHPEVHRYLRINSRTGLWPVLHKGMRWRENLVQWGKLSELDILPAGACDAPGTNLIGRTLAEILDEAANEYDLIVVDSPAILDYPEPLQMAAAVDGVILIARAGKTSRKSVRGAIATLRRVRANVIGVVLNSAQA